MFKLNRFLILSGAILMVGFTFLNFPGTASAMTPTLSLSATGSGDNVQINVVGDPNVSVLLFVGSQSAFLGNTNSSGIGLFTIGSSASENQSTFGGTGTNIVTNASVYVKTGGLNGTQSSNASWPYVTSSTTTSTLTLSQTALLLNAGQTSTITAGASYLYLLSNTNPAIANINLNSNQITVTANTYGSTVANICIVGSTTNCSSITITVQSSSAQQLNFSQNNFSIISGQNASVTVTGGSGVYTISNNSNPTSVQATLNGSVVVLTATSTSGAASITICTTDINNCGIINVSATTVNSSAISFSQTNPVVPVGQSTTVTIYGGIAGSNFYVSSNSNPSIVQVNITNNILTLIGNASTGTSNISVCAYAGSCASLVANVSSVASANGSMLLSQSSISILAGQSSNITISGGSTPYTISSSSSNIFNNAINGNVLTIYGVNPGSGTANVCSSTGCVTLSVTVNNVNGSINPPTFSQNNILLSIGQQTTVYISGNGNYYVSTNSNSNVAMATVSANAVMVTANASGNTNFSICQNGGQCAVLYVTVSTPASVVVPVVPATPAYVLPRYLGYGDKGDDVLQLQKLLVKEGLLSATPNGHYGVGTKLAIQKFQKAHGIRQTGNVGQSTKDALNKIWASAMSSPVSVGTTKEQQISAIQQAIQQLLAQASQIQGQ